MPVLDERVVETPDEAVDAARAVAPIAAVVAKLCGDAIAHKTERGSCGSASPTTTAVRRQRPTARRGAPDDGEVACSSPRWCTGNRELIAGLLRDPQFGPCVMLGVGGVLAEALADVVFRLVPIDGSTPRR